MKENIVKTSGIRLTTQIFKERSIKIHNGYYKYGDDIEYVNYYTKVPIICPIHGVFLQKPSEHLNGKGCPKCGRIKTVKTTHRTQDEFIRKAREIHGDKIIYDEVKYVDCKTKVKLICPIHGEFWKTLDKHINSKQGCPICSGAIRHTTDSIIDVFNKIHNNKYDYTYVNYENSSTKIPIICHETDEYGNEHGLFWQDPNHHASGCGCPKCRNYHLENEIENMLEENNITYEKQKKFKWLGKKSLDFYIPKINVAIECQGEQHYRPIDYFGGKKNFLAQHKRDEDKKKLCDKNNITILYYSKSNLADKGVFKDAKILIKEINDRYENNS